ncbi:MAG: DUF2281 domain-containing protein [Pyrinomonadaceae bacterium]
MTVKEAVLEKLDAMPTFRQQEVLDFAEFLEAKQLVRKPRRSMQGVLSHLKINFTEADMREARNEMWRGYTKDSEDEK